MVLRKSFSQPLSVLSFIPMNSVCFPYGTLPLSGILSMEITSTGDINRSVDHDHRDIGANEWKFSTRIYEELENLTCPT